MALQERSGEVGIVTVRCCAVCFVQERYGRRGEASSGALGRGCFRFDWVRYGRKGQDGMARRGYSG